MTEIRTGFDYHLATVRRHHVLPTAKPRHWVAYCDACGWLGPYRETKTDAAVDADEHDLVSNPPSNR